MGSKSVYSFKPITIQTCLTILARMSSMEENIKCNK